MHPRFLQCCKVQGQFRVATCGWHSGLVTSLARICDTLATTIQARTDTETVGDRCKPTTQPATADRAGRCRLSAARAAPRLGLGAAGAAARSHLADRAAGNGGGGAGGQRGGGALGAARSHPLVGVAAAGPGGAGGPAVGAGGVVAVVRARPGRGADVAGQFEHRRACVAVEAGRQAAAGRGRRAGRCAVAGAAATRCGAAGTAVARGR
ncbi:hypothetical protein G6F57_017017 [Rhizopus arrhizus]|nr:hypothetical protein G6F57_017017 [Rhizopus arrhizus]